MRSSTGSVTYSSAYDDYYPPPRGSRDYGPSPRSSGDRIAAPRMLTRNYDDDPLSSAKLRDDYMTRPRRSTLEPEPGGIRKPLSVIPTSSPNRVRPVITSAMERASGHHTKPSRSGAEEDYYLLPATSGSRHDHRRISSANTADLGRLTTGDKELRDRMDRAGYRGSTSNNGRQGYHLNGPLVRHQDPDAYDGYSYTDPREQMYRDTAPRPRPRRDSLPGGRRERPLSMTGLEDYLPRPGPAIRETGPPPSRRGFDKIPRSESLRQSSRAVAEDQRPRDYVPPRNEDSYDIPKRRTSTRKPVSLHQRNLDDGYESYQDAYNDPYERHRQSTQYDDPVDRKDYGGRVDSKAYRGWDDDDYDRDGPRTKSGRDHEHRRRDYDDDESYHRADRDKGSRKKHDREDETLAAGVAAGLTGGLVGAESRDRDRRRHEEREKDPHEPSMNGGSHDRDRHNNKPSDYGAQDGDTSGEERRERRRRRRREREALEREALEREREERDPRDEGPRGRTSEEQDDDDRDSEQEERRRRDHRHQKEDSRERLTRDGSDGGKPVDKNEERPRSAGVVSPAREKEPEQPVKGILRPPREKFPEDPAPVREGVAPLKDAGKKGIPVNARWTKIDRKLVNPEALEEGHERYEERLDYVIVLRVLTKEEIQAYAAKTQEIRGKRAHAMYCEDSH